MALTDGLARLKELPEEEDDLSGRYLTALQEQSDPLQQVLDDIDEESLGSVGKGQQPPPAETTQEQPQVAQEIPPSGEAFDINDPSLAGGVNTPLNPDTLEPTITPEQVQAESLEQPFFDPVTAAATGALGGGLFAFKAGASAARVVATGLLSGASAAATDLPIGQVIEQVAAKYPALALPTAILLGVLSGATIEAAFQKMALKRGEAVFKVFKDLRAKNRAAGMNAADAADDALENTLVQAAKEDPEGLAELDRAVQAARAEDVAAREAPTAGAEEGLTLPKPRARVTTKSGTPDEIKAFLKDNPDAIEVGDKALKVDFSAIDNQDDITDVINRITKLREPDIESARGVQPDALRKEMAKKLNMSLEDFMALPEREALNPEQMQAFIDLFGASTKKLLDLRRAANAGEAGAMEALTKHFGLHAAIQEKLFGFRARAGQTLRVLGQDADGNIAFMDHLGRVVEDTAGRKVTPHELLGMLNMLETPEQLAKFAREASRPGRLEVFQSIWINSLVSGPRTFFTNILGNLLTLAYDIPKRAIAPRLPGASEVQRGEALSMLFGIQQSYREALELAWRSFKTGERAFGPTKLDADSLSKQTDLIDQFTANNPFDRSLLVLAKVTNKFGRGLTAMDQFSQMISYRAELYSRAYRIGVSEGLEGKELAQRIAGVLDDPPSGLDKAAREFAAKKAFVNDLDGFGKKLQALSNDPYGKFTLPFVKTLVNITKTAVEYTPGLNLMFRGFRADFLGRNGKAAQELARAQMAQGMMLAGTVSAMTAAGYITGGGPDDPAQKEQLRLATPGWQPYSIRIGDKYVSFNRLGPVGMFMGLIADFTENAGQLVSDTDGITSGEIAMAIVLPFRDNLLRQTFLLGVASQLSAMAFPERNFEREFTRFVGTLVPGSSLARQFNDAFISPGMKDAREVMDGFKLNTFGQSGKIPAVRNIFGDKVVLNAGFGQDNMGAFYRFISPVDVTSAKKKADPVGDELARLGKELKDPIVGFPSRSIDGEPMSTREYEQYVVLAGKGIKDNRGDTLKQALSRVIKSPQYKGATNKGKAEIVRTYVLTFREAARARMIGDDRKAPANRELAERVRARRQRELDESGVKQKIPPLPRGENPVDIEALDSLSIGR